MISNAEKIKSLPAWKKCVKLIHQILVPLLWLPALVCSLLCCFKPAEGSNSRTICIIIAASCYLIIFGIKYLNKRFTNKEMAYRTFQNTTVKNWDLPNLIPLLALTVVIALPFYLLFVTSLKSSRYFTFPSTAAANPVKLLPHGFCPIGETSHSASASLCSFHTFIIFCSWSFLSSDKNCNSIQNSGLHSITEAKR